MTGSGKAEAAQSKQGAKGVQDPGSGEQSAEEGSEQPTRDEGAVNVRVPQKVLELLDDYCKFLGGATYRTYVIVEALRQTISKDKKYRKTRASKPAGGGASTVEIPRIGA